MKITKKFLTELIDSKLDEFMGSSFSGHGLPNITGEPYQEIGPFSQYVRSAADVLDRILQIVNDESADLDKIDVQEFLYTSVPKLENKIDTLCDAIERKTGFKKLDKTKQKPLVPPQERNKRKIKIK